MPHKIFRLVSTTGTSEQIVRILPEDYQLFCEAFDVDSLDDLFPEGTPAEEALLMINRALVRMVVNRDEWTDAFTDSTSLLTPRGQYRMKRGVLEGMRNFLKGFGGTIHGTYDDPDN